MRGQHLQYRDGWRGLAIGTLLLGHFFPYLRMELGTAGVNLFFVLSGILMGRLLFIQETPIQLFYKRRVSRILPGFYFYIAAIVIWALAAGVPVAWRVVASSGMFLRNYYPAGWAAGVPLDHLWSLAV